MMPTGDQSSQAVLYSFLTETVLPMLRPNGVWAAPSPAPLSADQVEEVFETVLKDDHYKRQTLGTLTRDGYLVTVKEGKIERNRVA